MLEQGKVDALSLRRGLPVVEGAFLDHVWSFFSSSKPDLPHSD